MLVELEQLLRRSYRMVKNELRNCTGQYLNSTEFIVLKVIHEYGPLKASDISKTIEVSASHITAITDSLVEKGFITRKRSDIDRRRVELEITEKGKEMLKFAAGLKSEYFQKKFSHFTNEELETFIQLLKKLNSPFDCSVDSEK
ncbi:MAG: MarR family transcriptional regulator [Bacillales bacterium]|nr:MarR family transcriptional regulator [Bacillales bacterium]